MVSEQELVTRKAHIEFLERVAVKGNQFEDFKHLKDQLDKQVEKICEVAGLGGMRVRTALEGFNSSSAFSDFKMTTRSLERYATQISGLSREEHSKLKSAFKIEESHMKYFCSQADGWYANFMMNVHNLNMTRHSFENFAKWYWTVMGYVYAAAYFDSYGRSFAEDSQNSSFDFFYDKYRSVFKKYIIKHLKQKLSKEEKVYWILHDMLNIGFKRVQYHYKHEFKGKGRRSELVHDLAQMFPHHLLEKTD